MKKLVICLLLIAGAAWAQESDTEKVYDRYGSYQGEIKTDSHGDSKLYDRYGSYQGEIKEKANGDKVLYDRYGSFKGEIKK